jgi:pimeloyl-ACP methyl ester carboxylesterase
VATYVLVHGAWHAGAELEPTAAPIRAASHEVHTPTIAGNRPGDAKTVSLNEAIKSIVDYITQKNLKDVILVGHSYGGMVITGVADQIPDKIRRLVYWNAFVPNNGESLNDLVPPPYVALFDQIAAERGDSSVVLPFPIWREAFINGVDLASAQKAYDILNPHPLKTFCDKISLKTNPAANYTPWGVSSASGSPSHHSSSRPSEGHNCAAPTRFAKAEKYHCGPMATSLIGKLANRPRQLPLSFNRRERPAAIKQ